VRLSLGDRLSWAPLQKQLAVRAELDRIPGRPLYTPILAPLFYERLAERDVAAPTRLETILRFLGPRRLEGQRVLDIGSNIGFYAQHFAREGALVTGVEPDPEHVRLAELLNELCGVRYQIRREPFQDCEIPPHEVGLALTVFYHFSKDPAVRARFLQRIQSSVTTVLFWESGDEPEKEKGFLLEGTHFNRYQKLKDTYGTGKPRELGVFTRA
jgi:SAM-dependent methyltransferase